MHRSQRLALAISGALAAFAAVPVPAHAAAPRNGHDPCARIGRDSCRTAGVGFYGASRYGIRWYGDFRTAVPGQRHTFCLDLRFWYASPAYRYRRVHAVALRTRAGVRVAAADRHRIAYAIWNFGRSGRPARQAAVMLYVHARMGDARPGELDPPADRPNVAALVRRIAHASARYAGPYRIKARLPVTLVVGREATATVHVLAASGAAVPHVPLALSASGATGVVAAARTDAAGVARIALTPTTAGALALGIRTGRLASSEPAVFAPTAGEARGNGQRLAAPASQRLSTTLSRSDVLAAPTLTAQAKPSGVAVGSPVADTVTVAGLGGASASVQVELYGPFASPSEVACTAMPVWSDSFVSAGDGTRTTASVTLDRAGYYGYRASIAAQGQVEAIATPCGLTAQTTVASARPALSTTISAALVRPGAPIFDRLTVHGLGATPATIGAELYGPFGSRAAIDCDAAHLVWKGKIAVAGDGPAQTPPVHLARAGFYGYREYIAAQPPLLAGAATPCAPRQETALAIPQIVTGRGELGAHAESTIAPPPRPTRIRVASLGIDAPVVASRIDVADGVLGIPQDIHRTGWWRDGALPGAASGAILLAGHRDSAHGGPGALFPLDHARTGDRIELETGSGRRFTYRVVSVRLYRKHALPTSIYASSGRARLVLVTCGGPFNTATGHYTHNVVVTATPAP
jgi:hypothetical protein